MKKTITKLLVSFAILGCGISSAKLVANAQGNIVNNDGSIVAVPIGDTAPTADGNILPNVFIDGIAVGGMTRQQAIDACQSSVDSYATMKVNFIVEDQAKEMDMASIGYTTNVESIVDKALMCGKKGNPLKRFKDSTELSMGMKSEQLNISPSFDQSGKDAVSMVISEFNREQVSATISMNADSTFDITPGQTGITVDVDGTMNALAQALSGEWGTSVNVAVVYTETAPEADEEVLSQMTDELGTFTTYYGGDSNRMRNVENAVSFINGTLLMPGEELDVNATIEPYTEENGYYYAGEYSGGKVVQGLGGGICQVSTTLYNAVLFAELEVVERYNHSLTVGYVDLSRDAAIAGTIKNFVFKNNMDTPIYIAGGCSNGYITFAIYGKDTRPENRTIEFESKLIETIAPPAEPVETEDPALEPGERKVTQKPHTGYVAELWKNIYVDGVLQDSVKVNSSKYNSSPEYVSVGPGGEGSEDGGDSGTTTESGGEIVETPNVAPEEGESPPEN